MRDNVEEIKLNKKVDSVTGCTSRRKAHGQNPDWIILIK